MAPGLSKALLEVVVCMVKRSKKIVDDLETGRKPSSRATQLSKMGKLVRKVKVTLQKVRIFLDTNDIAISSDELGRNCSDTSEKLVHVSGLLDMHTSYDRVGSSSWENTLDPRWTCRRNALHVVLDFDKKDDRGENVTLEGQLRALVMTGANMPAAVGRKIAVSGGGGGVGKTPALRGLATDRDVQNQFSGGIYFVVARHNTAAVNVLKQLGEFCTFSAARSSSRTSRNAIV